MKYYLTKKERDSIMESLSNEQKDFLTNKIRRGKRTEFANLMAKEKGFVITENMTLEEVEDILEEWILVEYIDGGKNYKSLKEPLICECGKVLRYQYIVKHKDSGESKKFGVTHFEEHTGIPARIIKDIKKGFEKIDYELDELLLKIRDGWTLRISIPSGFEIPMEFEEQFKLDLPLLDRQETRLMAKMLENSNRQQEPLTENQYNHKQQEPLTENQFNHYKVSDKPYELPENLKVGIKELLNLEVCSAIEICKILITQHGAPATVNSSKRLSVYTPVVLYLESLVKDGYCIPVSKDFNDCVYKIKQPSLNF